MSTLHVLILSNRFLVYINTPLRLQVLLSCFFLVPYCLRTCLAPRYIVLLVYLCIQYIMFLAFRAFLFFIDNILIIFYLFTYGFHSLKRCEIMHSINISVFRIFFCFRIYIITIIQQYFIVWISVIIIMKEYFSTGLPEKS